MNLNFLPKQSGRKEKKKSKKEDKTSLKEEISEIIENVELRRKEEETEDPTDIDKSVSKK